MELISYTIYRCHEIRVGNEIFRSSPRLIKRVVFGEVISLSELAKRENVSQETWNMAVNNPSSKIVVIRGGGYINYNSRTTYLP